jgi:DNA topoisomerase-1
LEFYSYNKVKEEALPELKKGDVVKVDDKELLSKKTNPPPRYSQGTLLKLMEDLNLGTKSTRPTIIDKLYARQYIEGKKQIKPSELAKAVILSLENHAETVAKPDMTAKLEDEMNFIEEGKIKKDAVVLDSREMLSQIISELEQNKEAISKDVNAGKNNIEIIGVCKCGGNLRKMISKRGKRFISCSNFPNCKITYPLPQKGELIFENLTCDVCGAPRIKLKGKSGELNICINPECKTNKDWREQYNKKKQPEETKDKIVKKKKVSETKTKSATKSKKKI